VAKESKYIVIEQNGFKSAILFDDTIAHSDFKPIFNNIVSAGFFDTDIKNGKIVVSTFGRSLSMKLESSAEDAKLIEKLLNHSFF